jgi:glycosyltransferase involved in cell wall biosynthesis
MTTSIAVVINSMSTGGAERVAANLVNEWAAREVEVALITLSGTELDFYAIDPRVRRIALRVAGDSDGVFAAIANNMRRVLALRRTLRSLRPDIALGLMSSTNVLVILACQWLTSIRVIVSEHIFPPRNAIGRPWHWLRKIAYPLADAVALLTVESLEWLRREIPRARGTVIPNAISYPIASGEPVIAPDVYVGPDRKLLLAVGRLAEQKGFDLLLEAFRRVAPMHAEWDLAILGDGPMAASLRARREECRLTFRVHIPGRAGNVGDWYERADMYVMSSRYEGFPLSLGEAMAYGCAAVSYDCDTGPRDLIRPGLDGVLVKPVGDVNALARALSELMDDEAKRRRIAAEAKHIRERYSPECVMQMWERTLFGSATQTAEPDAASLAGLPEVKR